MATIDATIARCDSCGALSTELSADAASEPCGWQVKVETKACIFPVKHRCPNCKRMEPDDATV